MIKTTIQEAITHIQSKKNPPPMTEEEAIEQARHLFEKPLFELLILARLNQSDSYGYEILQSIKKESGGRILIPEGAMYPTLYRLLGNQQLTEYQADSGKTPLRVYYKITDKGRGRLKGLLKEYEDICTGCQGCLAAMVDFLP